LLKQSSSNELATAIRKVHEGKTFFSAAISKRVQDRNRGSLDRSANAVTSVGSAPKR